MNHRMRTQKGDRVCQEASRPSKLQAVEKVVAQAKLVFVKGLRRLNPRPALIKQPLRYLAVGRNGSIKDLMLSGRVRELPWAVALLPAPRAEWLRIQDAKPVQLVARVQPKPMQALSLFATHPCGRVKRIRHPHVRTPFCDYRHVVALTQPAVHSLIDVGHVADDDVRGEVQNLRAVPDAGLQEKAFAPCSGRRPRDEWHQHNAIWNVRQPYSERVLLVADIPTALA